MRASEPYHGGTEPLMRIRILEKPGVAGGERLGEKNNNIVDEKMFGKVVRTEILIDKN